MNTTKTIIGSVMVLVFIVGAAIAITRKPVDTAKNVNPTVATTTKTFTMADVKAHSKETDCFTTIDGKVYDLSTWAEKHPGGDKAIFFLCGIDGSAAYNGKHGGQKGPTDVLATFLIGNLVK